MKKETEIATIGDLTWGGGGNGRKQLCGAEGGVKGENPKAQLKEGRKERKKGGREKGGEEVGCFFFPPQILALWVAGKLMEIRALPSNPGCSLDNERVT